MDDDVNEDMVPMPPKVVFKSQVSRTDRNITDEELYSLYDSLDINVDEVNRRYNTWRLDVIHVRGVEAMSSEDVLQYFEAFDPNSIEWLNELSCNVVFADPKASAIAMTSLTTSLVVKTSDMHLVTHFQIDVTDAHSLSVPVPPGFRWRLGVTHHKSKALLLRFATNSDRKVNQLIEDNTQSDNVTNVWTKRRNRPVVTDVVQQLNPSDEEITDSGLELKTKRVRMRMRADDEQELIRDRLSNRNTSVRVMGRISRGMGGQRRSIWDRLDNDSFNNFGAVDTDLLETHDNNRQMTSASNWDDKPLRSTISVVRHQSNKNDLRTKIARRKPY